MNRKGCWRISRSTYFHWVSK